MTDKVNEYLECGADIAGNSAGTAIGLLVGGVGGAFAGAAATPAITTAIKLTTDFVSRQLSRREQARTAASILLACNRIYERIIDNESVREDEFFHSTNSQRSGAEEIFEGIVLKCKNEHEEKKLAYISYIFANAAFTNYSLATINDVLQVGEALTYRQICITAAFGRKSTLSFDVGFLRSISEIVTFGRISESERPFLHHALVQLSDAHGLLTYDNGNNSLLLESSLTPEPAGNLTDLGNVCFELMSLDLVPEDDIWQMTGEPDRKKPVL